MASYVLASCFAIFPWTFLSAHLATSLALGRLSEASYDPSAAFYPRARLTSNDGLSLCRLFVPVLRYPFLNFFHSGRNITRSNVPT